jgi:putative peptide zinc metalloprotease protein
LIPTPLRIQGSLVLRLARPKEVYIEVEGRLVELNVRNGEWVSKGTVLAKLSNPEKEKELIQRQQDQQVNFHKALWFGQSPEHENRAQAMKHEEFAEKLEPMIQKMIEQMGKLTLIADRDGQVVGLPQKGNEEPLHKETVGQWLKPENQPFCEIGDPHQLEAHLIIEQSDVHLIHPDSAAWVKIYGEAEKTYKSRVSEITKHAREEVPKELSQLAGGEVSTKQDWKTGAIKSMTAVYEVIIPIDNPDLTLSPGLRGAAKIDGGTYALYWWLWRTFWKMFDFQL